MFKAIKDFFCFYFVTPKPQTKKEEPAVEVKEVKKSTPTKPRVKPTKKQNGTAKNKTKKQWYYYPRLSSREQNGNHFFKRK